MTTTPRKYYEALCDQPGGGEKELTPMATLINVVTNKLEWLESVEIDDGYIKGGIEYLKAVRNQATSLLEAESHMVIVSNEEGVKYGCQTRNQEYWRTYDGSDYFTSKYKQQ